MELNADNQLSSNYVLGDFLVTEQSLSSPNLPSKQMEIDNLKYLADVCEDLLFNIGPFDILSGYRTKELQTKLGEGGNPVSKSLSFHEVGRAVDIFPTTMSIDTFFGKILSDERIKARFAEISIKPSQNSLHLAVNVPGDTRNPKITGLNSEHTYAALSNSDIQSYIDRAASFVTETAEAATEVVAKNKLPIMILVGGLGLGILYFTFLKSKRAAS